MQPSRPLPSPWTRGLRPLLPSRTNRRKSTVRPIAPRAYMDSGPLRFEQDGGPSSPHYSRGSLGVRSATRAGLCVGSTAEAAVARIIHLGGDIAMLPGHAPTG